MERTDREGTAATLRAAALLVIAGICLGLAFNALGLAGRPPRGLPWIRQQERLPSLEDLQPGSSLVPVVRPRTFPGFGLVGTAWAGGTAPRTPSPDTARATVKRASAPAAKAPVKAAKVGPQPVRPAVGPVGGGSAPAAAAAPADLPVVPDLDRPIEVRLANARKFHAAGAAAIVDSREAAEYAAGHIAGALSLPYEEVTAKPALLEPFRKLGRPIIVYCDAGCETSRQLAEHMVAEGIRKVLVLVDGYSSWKAAGHPVEQGPAGARR